VIRAAAGLVLLLAAPVAAAQQPASSARGLIGTYDAKNPFARIIRGEAPASKVYEDATVLVLMPLTMAKPGHVLIIPKRLGARTLLDLTPAELTACLIAVQKAGRAQMAALGATGFQVRQNNGSDAAQAVFHPHFHVIPFVGPDKALRPDAEHNTRAELDAMAARLRAAWPKD
jgi:histidine triad (HIT) family protein